jgi:hypothetical protein
MKETEQKDAIAIESVKRQEIEKKIEYLGSLKPQRNHILFEINLKERTIVRAEFESKEVDFESAKDKSYALSKKVLVKPDCFYISALNEKNVRKVLKNKFGVTL